MILNHTTKHADYHWSAPGLILLHAFGSTLIRLHTRAHEDSESIILKLFGFKKCSAAISSKGCEFETPVVEHLTTHPSKTLSSIANKKLLSMWKMANFKFQNVKCDYFENLSIILVGFGSCQQLSGHGRVRDRCGWGLKLALAFCCVLRKNTIATFPAGQWGTAAPNISNFTI